jgi:DNA polymerase III subunit delta
MPPDVAKEDRLAEGQIRPDEKTPPVIYLLHGDDQVSMDQLLKDLEAKMGASGFAEMNISRLDGRSYDLDGLLSEISAMPFGVNRRMVILKHPTARLPEKQDKKEPPLTPAQEKFLDTLSKTPESTALVLVEYQPLTSDRDRRNNRLHWLEKWAQEQPEERVYLKLLSLPRGAALVRWIQEKAKHYGGQVTPQAAYELIRLVGEEPRLIEQEIQKLLAYVNYRRPIELDDVQAVTVDTAEGNIFVLVDALGSRDKVAAMGMLQRLLEEQEAQLIFGMVVRQFRLLLQTREMLDEGKTQPEIARQLKLLDFIARKLIAQAQYFTMQSLEAIYRHLLNVDDAAKTGGMTHDLSLQLLIVELSAE